jgi:DNA-binding MarR family transcriptional regulator
MKRYAEFYFCLTRTLGTLQREIDDLLKTFGVSEPQYNVLNVLQEAYPESLSCGDIAGKMVSRDPDITRLLDRLERSGFIERRRGSPDRRLVFVKILEPGMQLMDALREPVARLQERQFASLQDSDIQALLECLARVRSRVQESTLTRDGRPVHTPSFALAGAR